MSLGGTAVQRLFGVCGGHERFIRAVCDEPVKH